MKITIFFLVFSIVFLSAIKPTELVYSLKLKLSEFNFFKGELRNLDPNNNIFSYQVNAPLFSDYAEKARFIYLPEGEKMNLTGQPDSLFFELPVGTILIKNFYYSFDQRHPENGRRILETRLLLHEKSGWKPLEYIWNDAQTDADLAVAGGNFPVNWTDENGKKQSIEYLAPNLNQCKSCHSFDGKFVPIGINLRQLNQSQSAENQLVNWQKNDLLTVPENFGFSKTIHFPDPFSPENSDLETRARAYLDSNCGHCHNPHGPASTSGMFLNFDEKTPAKLGIEKLPVAAGRGSGGRKFGIVPGKPNESILIFRMENDDPGIRMPEVGRQILHREGVELVAEWIRKMKT